MKRVHLAWMNSEKLASDAWRALRFDVPLLRWTLQADNDARHSGWNSRGETRARAAIWGAAGELLHWRHDKEQRQHIRLALGLLRRCWLAHCAGRQDLCREQFNAAMLERQHATAAPLAAKAGEAWLAEQKRIIIGKRAHRGKPERLTDKIAKAIAANPGVSNAKIAELVGTSESSVWRRRQR